MRTEPEKSCWIDPSRCVHRGGPRWAWSGVFMSYKSVTLRFLDGRLVCSDRASSLYLARLVSAVGSGHGLLAWRDCGRQIALLFGPEGASAGQAARRISIGAQQVIGGGGHFARARIETVTSDARLQALFDDILLRADSPFFAASSLPDALGTRGLAPYLRGSLARCTPHPRLIPVDVRPLSVVADWSCLPESTGAVFGYPDLARRFKWRSSALSAASSLAFPEIGPSRLARILRVSRSTVGRALDRPASRSLSRMIEAQLRWRSDPVRRAGR